MAKNFVLVYFPSDESTAVVVNTPNVILAGDICERSTISVLWSNGISYKGRVVDFNEKRKPLGDVQKKFVKVLVESNMDFDAAFAKFKGGELSDYEKLRLANIKEIEEKKKELGLDQLSLVQKSKDSQKKKAKAKSPSSERVDDSEDSEDSEDYNETPEQFLAKLSKKNKAKKRKSVDEDKENNNVKQNQKKISQTKGPAKRQKKSSEEKEKENQEKRCQVLASLNNIEREILENKEALYTASPSCSTPSTPCSALSSSIQSPPLFSSSGGPLTASFPAVNQSTPLQARVTGISSESTSPVFPVIVGSNSDQQAVMIGRLMETVHLMQQKMEKMEKQIQKLLANKQTTQMPVRNVIEILEESASTCNSVENRSRESPVNSVQSRSHGSLVEELREFLQHKSDFGRAVKDCMLKIFTEQEMKTCSVRGKKSKQGKQRECLPGDKLSAIIDTVKEKFGQSADVVYKMNQVLRNFPGREN